MAVIRSINTISFPHKADAADLSPEEIVEVIAHAHSRDAFSSKFATTEEFDSFLDGHTEESSKTYYPNIDTASPLPVTGVVVMSGRPGHGKSSLMRNIALKKAEHGEKVVYITYEFSQQKEILNFISTKEGRSVTRNEAVTTQGYKDIIKLVGKNLLITHKVKNIEDIQAMLMQDEFKGASVFIDYIQKVPSTTFSGDATGSEAHIRHVCNILNDLYISQDLLIIIGSQLTQSSGSPTLDVVKGARAIEEVASVIFRIWRHGVTEGNLVCDMVFKKGDYNFTIDVLKNREGASGARLGLYTLGGLSLINDREGTSND